MKRAKKPKQERVTLKRSELMEMCNEQVRKAFLLMATAAADELDLDEDQLTAIAERSARYAEYIDDHCQSVCLISTFQHMKYFDLHQ